MTGGKSKKHVRWGSSNAYLAVQCMYLTLIITALQIVLMGLKDTGVASLEDAC
jgi:hypothetical protein